MTMPDIESSVTAFFDAYRMAFERLDAPAIADHFASPSHMTSDTGEIVLATIVDKQDWIGQIERVLDMYRSIGFSSARALEVTATKLSPRLGQAIVHWELHDSAGRILYDFEAAYTLANVGGRMRIAALAHNEIRRYRTWLQSRPTPGEVLPLPPRNDAEHEG
jgi:hypothetical protein